LPAPGNTTHFAVVDRWRNLVAVTTTLNTSFGSKAVAAGTGVLLNDEMDDFSLKPGAPNTYKLIGGIANEIRPGKRPLSSMAPTIVLKNNQPYLVLGTPGGGTIITSVVQVFLDVVEHGMSLGAAVAAPRVHHQWTPDRIEIEEGALDPSVQAVLEKMGHTIVIYERNGVRDPIGDFQAIRIDGARGLVEGVSDPRGPGEPRGY
jgi:gamma-glutamyltranspeptidase/glutathione hydrolase